MTAATQGYTVWEALGITIGGIVGAVGVLTALTKIPGTRWIFERLVKQPAREWLATENEFIAVRAAENAARAYYEPLAVSVDQINEAVNNVGPGHPKLKERVANTEEAVKVVDQKLDVVIGMVQSIVSGR